MKSGSLPRSTVAHTHTTCTRSCLAELQCARSFELADDAMAIHTQSIRVTWLEMSGYVPACMWPASNAHA
eukprot:6207382-Pleurochrysis_carterae.AAC.2